MTITFDDFAKLEIKIGTIVSVETVPDTDKLLRLSVDVGESEPRQIISGIKHFFEDYETIVGRQAPFLVNLEPRTIKGLESQGMILAVGNDEEFSLLSPDKQVPPGTTVG